MKVVILTEAGREIGFGHFTRCLALIQAFAEKGIPVGLLVDGDDSFKTLYDTPEVKIVHWRQDGVIDGLLPGVDVVVIDSYLASIDLYNKVSSRIAQVLYLDDYHRLNYPDGIIWNGAIGVEEMDYGREKSSCLLGVDYALVRKDFWEARVKEINKEIGSILVTLGGEGRYNVFLDLVQYLSTQYPGLKKRIIIPRTFFSVEKIRGVMDQNSSLVLYPNGQQMREEMQTADIAISAGGQTLYELARVGVPTVGICLFDNQRTNLSNWLNRGFIDFVADPLSADLMDHIGHGIDRLRPYQERLRRSEIGRRLVDGQGAKRVVDRFFERPDGEALCH